ncbi:patatin-like phospholipase family protein [Peribacillus frigoritolerans]|jgi:NTE family protein|uniref:patatin-like phospholipase family protein n=1 Tax=Peribacillus frigoritolerans TaxID=450367 RepID=UPI0007BF4069|nr:patatin-like phospholipase family protein [Peribacillus frigoritolerans]MCK2016700.1 patatin-like phospholipase family protein [Peribacillus frigoritolerans]MDF1997111.1 patatin-like phospholipase family protein [Peribacillus frigoritolerans]MEB2490590.1 patatin-like phospholipase family protein [Peribacillus frigoritolerans]WHY12423.1 patatin-like phospholipase family protein [Peribacillus frigoritolerans]
MIIDGVFSGGGIKGYGLVGALQELEEKGFVFHRTAGTSAGSIIAAFVAAGYTGKEMEKFFLDIDLSGLLDKRRGLLPIPFAKWLLLYWKLGLYKGNALEAWVAGKLAERNVVTFKDVRPKSLRIITSDISNGKLVVLPDDLPNYGIDPSAFPVAKAVRMSCSIPYFYEPVKLNVGKSKFLFVDGGVLSNFPMWLFNSDHVRKERPVIGLRLSVDEIWKPHEVDNAVELFSALFKTMKDAHDARYISKKHVHNIVFIPMKGISAMDFNLNDEKKSELINKGRQCTKEFLKKWTY